MWFESTGLYFLANEDCKPLLVKFDDQVSYMPVFETRKEATVAANTLAVTHAEALRNTGFTCKPAPFTWSDFQKLQGSMGQLGHILFLYPMAPSEYRNIFQTHAADTVNEQNHPFSAAP